MTDICDQVPERDVGDWIDAAVRCEEDFLAGAREAQQRADQTQGKTVADSAENCSSCGAAIPQARREAVPGVDLCVACRTRVELYNKQRGIR
ncbi:TraR/DksA C4-type zinc finger protein [Rhodocyclus tenuis]|uniref:Phage/conjugal plasmid C-4 type zinc finger TraR family protein n=1 Tax=Rhodocyclus tenuis TaxID=1066 RepID=A0A840G928_RHOTE|nr:TraR/DksA family transcriptional regulator [Rhodocyclus tenuis]MBB4248375.1 phage/conjugal plasmid C-4 type zinc finger TraR family protein [Rhodocyclus tenuis]